MTALSSSLEQTIRKVAPGPVLKVAKAVKWGAWRVRCDIADGIDTIFGNHKPLTPPRRMWQLSTGAGNDFHTSGSHLLELCKEHGLQPNHAFLDVGCGIGRAAVAMTGYLDETGSYEGFDIIPDAIAWCQNGVTPHYPNFRFQLADVSSDRYHPAGSSKASAYVFPYPDNQFDFVFLGSVFTHMFPEDLRNYLSQIARVMRPGGTCVISYYLLDDERFEIAGKGGGAFSFSHRGDGYFAERAELPEAAIAFEQAAIEALYEEFGLEITTIRRGGWHERRVQEQDLIVARKLP